MTAKAIIQPPRLSTRSSWKSTPPESGGETISRLYGDQSANFLLLIQEEYPNPLLIKYIESKIYISGLGGGG